MRDIAPELWADGDGPGENAFLDGATSNAAAWQQLLDLQQTSGKDYSSAAFQAVVVPEARAD